jgi:hypothetical protein
VWQLPFLILVTFFGERKRVICRNFFLPDEIADHNPKLYIALEAVMEPDRP